MTFTRTVKDRHSLKTPNLKSEKPFGFRNGITISNYKVGFRPKSCFPDVVARKASMGS
jgi:hypothetical protein